MAAGKPLVLILIAASCWHGWNYICLQSDDALASIVTVFPSSVWFVQHVRGDSACLLAGQRTVCLRVLCYKQIDCHKLLFFNGEQLKIIRIKKVSFEVLVYMSSQNSVDLELLKQLTITRIKKKSQFWGFCIYVLPKQRYIWNFGNN